MGAGLPALGADAVGIEVVDEDGFEVGIQGRHEQVVDHPVGKGRGVDLAGLGAADGEADGAGGLPPPGGEVVRGLHEPVS